MSPKKSPPASLSIMKPDGTWLVVLKNKIETKKNKNTWNQKLCYFLFSHEPVIHRLRCKQLLQEQNVFVYRCTGGSVHLTDKTLANSTKLAN